MNFSSSSYASATMPTLTDAQAADVLGQVVDRVANGGSANLAFIVSAANDVVGGGADSSTPKGGGRCAGRCHVEAATRRHPVVLQPARLMLITAVATRGTRPVTLSVRVPRDLLARLDATAAKACVNRSALVAAILASSLPDLEPKDAA